MASYRSNTGLCAGLMFEFSTTSLIYRSLIDFNFQFSAGLDFSDFMCVILFRVLHINRCFIVHLISKMTDCSDL